MRRKKRYPKELFIMGLFMTLIRTALIAVLALILTALCLLFPKTIPSALPPILLAAWLIYAVIDQLRVRRRVMTDEHPLLQHVTDPERADDWKDLLLKHAEEKIQQADSERREAADDSENKDDREK